MHTCWVCECGPTLSPQHFVCNIPCIVNWRVKALCCFIRGHSLRSKRVKHTILLMLRMAVAYQWPSGRALLIIHYKEPQRWALSTMQPEGLNQGTPVPWISQAFSLVPGNFLLQSSEPFPCLTELSKRLVWAARPRQDPPCTFKAIGLTRWLKSWMPKSDQVQATGPQEKRMSPRTNRRWSEPTACHRPISVTSTVGLHIAHTAQTMHTGTILQILCIASLGKWKIRSEHTFDSTHSISQSMLCLLVPQDKNSWWQNHDTCNLHTQVYMLCE